MNPVRIFAMSTAHPINPMNVGRSTSGTETTPAVAAAMCSGMPKLWYHAALLKWADDWSGASDLEYYLWIKAVDIRLRDGWTIPPGRRYLRRMAGLAIAETAMPSVFGSDIERAKFLGMDKSRFSRVWKPRYELVYQELNDLASYGYRYVAKKNLDIGATEN